MQRCCRENNFIQRKEEFVCCHGNWSFNHHQNDNYNDFFNFDRDERMNNNWNNNNSWNCCNNFWQEPRHNNCFNHDNNRRCRCHENCNRNNNRCCCFLPFLLFC